MQQVDKIIIKQDFILFVCVCVCTRFVSTGYSGTDYKITHYKHKMTFINKLND